MNKKTEFIDCVAWEKLAENIALYMSKGKKLGVVGRLQKRDYEDKDGRKRYVTEVVCESVEFLSPMGAVKEDKPDYELIDDEQMPF